MRYRAGLDQASVRPGDVVRIADPLTAGERNACRIVAALGNDTDTIYRLAENEPSAPAGGETLEAHMPAGWTRVAPARTRTESVWRAQRTRTFRNGAFESATAWGNVQIEIAAGVSHTMTLTGGGTYLWTANAQLDAALTAGGAAAYFRSLRLISPSISMRLSASPDAGDGAGPEFTDGIETGTGVFVLSTMDETSSVTFNGPAHADNDRFHPDPTEPYDWTPPDNAVREWVDANQLLGHEMKLTIQTPPSG